MNRSTKYILIGLGIVLLIGLGVAISVSAKSEIKECTPGEKRYAKCEEPTSTDYGESRESGFCNQDGKWMSTELVPGWCLPAVVSPCVEGEIKCADYDKYQCIEGKWIEIAHETPECGADLCAQITCPDICGGRNLYSQKCDPSTANCVEDTLIEDESLSCISTARINCIVYVLGETLPGTWAAPVPIPNAKIKLTPPNDKFPIYTATTDSTGWFQIGGIYIPLYNPESGTFYPYTIEISADNFKTLTETIVIYQDISLKVYRLERVG